MAEIVLGLGTSHSPMLSLPGNMWGDYAARDKGNPMLLSLEDGSTKTYDELLATADPAIATRLTVEKFEAQFEACQKGLVALEEALLQADPDVVVIVGDDQEELFFDDNMPMFSIYWGDTMHLTPRSVRENSPPAVKASMWGYGTEDMDVPVDSELALHLIQWMIVDNEIDIRHARYCVLEAAQKADSGERFRTEAAMAKLIASEASSRVVDRCIQIHGGIGVTKDLPLERWYRELRIRRIGEGPSEVQRLIMARDILGGSFK